MRILPLVLLAVLPGTVVAASTPGEQRCHPSYPDFCIPPPPPDLDCRDIAANRKPFRVRHDVRNPDPHRFDRDRDGRACEPAPRRA